MMHFRWPNYKTVDAIGEKCVPGNIVIELIGNGFPMLFVTIRGSDLYLHYMIDGDVDGEVVRYITVPTTKSRIRALSAGVLGVREVINIPYPEMYDVKNGNEYVYFGSIDINSIPGESLPAWDVVLKHIDLQVVDAALGFKRGNFEFVISGGKERNSTVPFGYLSEFLDASQRIAMDSWLFDNPHLGTNTINANFNTELKMMASKAASFAIEVDAENDVVGRQLISVITKYSKLFLAADSKASYELLDLLPTDFVKSLLNYFNVILKGECEVLISKDEEFTYLSPARLNKIKEHVDGANYSRRERKSFTGFLVGGNIKTEHFYFRSIESNQNFSGSLTDSFKSKHSGDMTLSKIKKYKAIIYEVIDFKFSKMSKSYELDELIEQ